MNKSVRYSRDLNKSVRYMHEISLIKDAKPNQYVHLVCFNRDFVITVTVLCIVDCTILEQYIKSYKIQNNNLIICDSILKLSPVY